LYGDRFYFLKRNNAILSILDARTGEVLFGPERLEGIDGEAGVYASPVGAAERVYIAGQNGVTLVLADGPNLEVLSRNELEDAFDASPAIVDDELFLRGRKYLYCLREPNESKASHQGHEAHRLGVNPNAGRGAEAAASDRGPIGALAWMAGCWVGEGGEECWLAPLGGTMLGVNRGPEREDRQPAFEFLRIVEQDGVLVFLASPGGQAPPVAFPATEIGEARVVFENPEHDFPQRITYWLEDGRTLRARVEALEDGEWGGFEATWKRGAWRRD
jgi:hypothetical protein